MIACLDSILFDSLRGYMGLRNQNQGMKKHNSIHEFAMRPPSMRM